MTTTELTPRAAPRSGRLGRGALVAAGLVTILAAVAFAASYVDGGYDHTCGSVLEPVDIYGDCRDVLHLRTAVVLGLAAAGVVLIIKGSVSREVGRRWLVGAGACGAAAALLLIANEAIRSGGMI